MLHKHPLYTVLLGTVLLAGCSAQPPKEYTEMEHTAAIHPEYSSTVIPYNIAPLNFDYQTEGKAYITELKAGTSRW